jgi:hypothetical protein
MLLIIDFFKKPIYVAKNYLNWWFIKVVYTLYLILFYLFLYYNTTVCLASKQLPKLLISVSWIFRSGSHKFRNLIYWWLSCLMTVAWQESERSEQPAWITKVSRFFYACRPWFGFMVIHANLKYSESISGLPCQLSPLNFSIFFTPQSKDGQRTK